MCTQEDIEGQIQIAKPESAPQKHIARRRKQRALLLLTIENLQFSPF